MEIPSIVIMSIVIAHYFHVPTHHAGPLCDCFLVEQVIVISHSMMHISVFALVPKIDGWYGTWDIALETSHALETVVRLNLSKILKRIYKIKK